MLSLDQILSPSSLFFLSKEMIIECSLFHVFIIYKSNFEISMFDRWIIGPDCLARGSSHGFAGNSRNVQGGPLRAETVQEKEQFP